MLDIAGLKTEVFLHLTPLSRIYLSLSIAIVHEVHILYMTILSVYRKLRSSLVLAQCCLLRLQLICVRTGLKRVVLV